MKVSVPLYDYLLVGLKQFSTDHVLVTSWLAGALCLYFSFDLMSDPASSDHAVLGGLAAFVGALHMYYVLQHVHERVKLWFIISLLPGLTGDDEIEEEVDDE